MVADWSQSYAPQPVPAIITRGSKTQATSPAPDNSSRGHIRAQCNEPYLHSDRPVRQSPRRVVADKHDGQPAAYLQVPVLALVASQTSACPTPSTRSVLGSAPGTPRSVIASSVLLRGLPSVTAFDRASDSPSTTPLTTPSSTAPHSRDSAQPHRASVWPRQSSEVLPSVDLAGLLSRVSLLHSGCAHLCTMEDAPKKVTWEARMAAVEALLPLWESERQNSPHNPSRDT